MAEELLGRGLRDPRRRHRPRLPAPRERGGADAHGPRRASSRRSGCTTGCSQLRGEKMAKSVGNIALLPDVAGPAGAATRCCCSSPAGHYRQPIQYSRRDADPGARAVRRHPRGRRARWSPGPSPDGARRAPRRVLRRAGRRLQHARARSPHVARVGPRRANRREGVGRRATCARCSASSGSTNLLEADAGAGARGPRELLAAAPGRAGEPQDFAEADRLRDELAAPRLGGPRHARGRRARRPRAVSGKRRPPPRAPRVARGQAPDLSPLRAATRSHEALRAGPPADPCTSVWATARAARRASRGWRRRSRGSGGRRAVGRRARPRSRAPTRTRASSPRSSRTRTPTPARAARGARPADRRARRGPGSAEPRRDRPHRRGGGRDRPRDRRAALGAEVTPRRLQGVGRRGRAPADRPGAQHRRLPGRREGAPACWVYGAGGRRTRALRPSPTTAAASCSSWAPRARACARGCAASCDALVALPLRGRIESLNVSAAAAVLLYQASRNRGELTTRRMRPR